MLVDANLLIYAVDSQSPFHVGSSTWLEAQINGPRRVGIPWPSILAFLRITTNPRAVANPLSPADAWSYVADWLAAEAVWVPLPTARHDEILGGLIIRHHVGADLIADAHMAALALEHGLVVCSADSDFARFSELRWENPITPPRQAR